MTSTTFSRVKFAGALVAAFLTGLVFASGFDLTQSSFAQQSRTASVTGAQPTTPPASVAELNVAFTTIAERVTPAVVSIQAERTQTTQNQRPRGNRQPSLEDFFGQFDPRFQQPQQASGTGFIVSPDGYVLTNNHVVANMDRVRVTLTDHRVFPARVLGRDPDTDVAVLKIDANNLPVAALGNDEAVKIGEWVLAIGNPLGLDFTVTAGIVSAKGRGTSDVPVNANNNWAITDFIQTDAAINPGNSGGPLVNIRGEVIGINTAIASTTGFYSGYGFAIPVTLAKDVMDDIIEHGRVRRAILGVTITQVTPEDAAAAGLKEIKGVLVQPYTDANRDSPARRAGLEPGDVIVKADGRETDRVSTLQRIVRAHEPGETVELEAMRFGQRKQFRVRLGEAADSTTRLASAERPSEPSEGGTASEKLGVTVEELTPEVVRLNRIPSDQQQGLFVVSVDPNGPSRNRLLPERDIIVGVLSPVRREIREASDLQQVLSRIPGGGYVSLSVYDTRARQLRVVNLRVGN
jgi:serine protease Do